MKKEIPLVSIACITYNQESYIRQCINGFLMQKTNFNFEIIIHDDASTDATASILREYGSSYPDLIIPILQSDNQWSQGVNPGFEFVFPRCRGKYIAICEGDDFWTDPLKLQKQVDFLELHADYGMVHTNYRVVDATNGCLPKYNRKWKSGDVLPDLLNGAYNIVTATTLFRTAIFNEVKSDLENLDFKMGDLPLWIELSSRSKVQYLDDVSTSYRQLENSASHSDDILKNIDFHYSGFQIKKYYSTKFSILFHERHALLEYYTNVLRDCNTKKCPALALEYYIRIIKLDLKSILNPKLLIFLLGTRFGFVNKIAKATTVFRSVFLF